MNFMTIFSIKLNPEITLEEIVEFPIESRVKNKSFESQMLIIVDSIDQIQRLFLTSDNKLGVMVTSNYKKYHFSLDDFAYSCKYEVYLEFLKQKKQQRYEIHIERMNMDSILFQNVSIKFPKEVIEKMKWKNKYDKNKNEGNCYLNALTRLCDHFPIYKFRDSFKGLSSVEQYDLADEHLKKFNKTLVLVNETEEKGVKFIQKCKGPSLIVFYTYSIKSHCEVVDNFELVGEIQPHVKEILNLKLIIKEFKIKKFKENANLA